MSNADKQLRAAQALVAANASRLDELKSHDSSKYIERVEKVDEGQADQSSIVLELSTPHEVNKIICKHPVSDGETHTCRRIFCNSIVKQYFNCWDYSHIGSQCHSIIKCATCVKTGHPSATCSTPKTRAKGTQRGGSHNSQHQRCPVRVKEVEKLKIARATTPSYYPTKTTLPLQATSPWGTTPCPAA